MFEFITRSRRVATAAPVLAVCAVLCAPVAWAEEAPAGVIDSGDTAWMIMASAMVLLMTPALALFYGGLVRAKNALSTIMHSLFAMGLMTLQWVVIGYSLAFSDGGSLNWFVGGFDHILLNGVGNGAAEGMTIPLSIFMIFQGMFAIITPALISGAFAERITFRGYVMFSLLWATLVYDPVCHWVWGGGWLGAGGLWGEAHALDFAGGTVVHVNAGIAALVIALILGRRIGYPHTAMKPHNLGMSVLGAGMLWFGWFGFNAGSELAVDEITAHAFVVTHIAAATATVAWAAIEGVHRGKASVLGAATGAVAGLVAITPACGFVGIGGAILIGAAVSPICYGALILKGRLGYDDSLDAFGVHGIGGAWGALATGIFASTAIGGTAGLLEGGGFQQVWIQIVSIIATAGYALVVTFVIAKVVDATVGLRVTEDEEREGLDLAAHGETAYDL